MKQLPFDRSLEDNLRALLVLAEDELSIRKFQLEDLKMTDSISYQKTVQALIFIERIKLKIGYKAPDTPLKQLPLFNE